MPFVRLKFVEDDSALTGDVLNALYTAVGWNERGARTSEKTQQLIEASPFFVAAWADDRLVGFGRVLTDIYWAQLLDVMTHPDFRRQGVAREVAARLVRYADGAGLPLMLIAAGEAKGLYKRLGFVEAKPDTDTLMYRSLP